jgi:hypothetical protein
VLPYGRGGDGNKRFTYILYSRDNPSVCYYLMIQFLKLNGSQANLIESNKNYPTDSIVIFAVDEENKVLGRVAILVLPHIENLEIVDDNNNGLLMKQLLTQAEGVLKELNRTCAVSFITNNNEKAIDYAQRYGYEKLPMTVWMRDLS